MRTGLRCPVMRNMTPSVQDNFTSEHSSIENYEGDRGLDYHAPGCKQNSCWNDM